MLEHGFDVHPIPDGKIHRRERAKCHQTLKSAEVGQTFCKDCLAWDRYFYHIRLANQYLETVR